MIPLIPTLALAFVSFISSAFIILRIVIPILPPSVSTFIYLDTLTVLNRPFAALEQKGPSCESRHISC
jgi:hypothetical protein